MTIAKQNLDAAQQRDKKESDTISEATINLEKAKSEEELSRKAQEDLIASYTAPVTQPTVIVPNGNGSTNTNTVISNTGSTNTGTTNTIITNTVTTNTASTTTNTASSNSATTNTATINTATTNTNTNTNTNSGSSQSSSTLSQESGTSGSFTISNWGIYLIQIYGGVKPEFSRSVTALYPFSYSSVVKGNNVYNNIREGGSSSCGSSSSSSSGSTTGVVLAVRDNAFDLREKNGAIVTVSVAPCTTLNSNKQGYKIRSGDVVVIKGERKSSKSYNGHSITCLADK